MSTVLGGIEKGSWLAALHQSSSSSSFRVRQPPCRGARLACEADLERMTPQSVGYGGQDFGELSRVGT